MNEEGTRARRLRDAGYKLTNARLTVLTVLEALGGHVTSGQVLEAVEQHDPSIGRASVFRTLDLLTHIGLIRPTYGASSITPVYVLMPDGHHHHMVCTRCNRVIEIDGCGMEQIQREIEVRLNVQVTGHLVEFFGLCETCKTAPPPDEE